MPKGQLYIKNTKGTFVDAYLEWGLSLTDGALSKLMTPAPIKDLIENKYRKKHGKMVSFTNVKLDERELTLELHFTASTQALFLERYYAFCEILAQGTIDLYTSFQPDVIYRLVYLSCSQFSNFRNSIAKFTLKVNEPDPSNREKDA